MNCSLGDKVRVIKDHDENGKVGTIVQIGMIEHLDARRQWCFPSSAGAKYEILVHIPGSVSGPGPYHCLTDLDVDDE